MGDDLTPPHWGGEAFSPQNIERASKAVERLCTELDITDADHIALWLEGNALGSTFAWLAVRIVEAHERVITRERIAAAEAMREACADHLGKLAAETPLGHENIQRGASTYNWLRYHEGIIRALDAKTVLEADHDRH